MESVESCVPPGFRFHPTEEELVGYYLKRKINSLKIDLDVIIDIDLYRIEPWDIQDRCKLGYEEQNEWYFFSHKDRKYPTGTRTNRATTAGFWKATGRDKAVLSKDKLIGMRKTLVFYKGRAPNGRKSDWIMHEYRLQTSEHEPPQEEGWVVCRAFKKPSPSHKQGGYEQANWINMNSYYGKSDYNNRPPSFPSTSSSNTLLHNLNILSQGTNNYDQNQLVGLQNLHDHMSPSISTSFAATNDYNIFEDTNNEHQYSSEWKSFDKLLESQVIGSSSFVQHPNMPLMLPHNDNEDVVIDNAQTHITHLLECFPDL
ncbi:hypothetical protein CASFOL_012624 [Castilleja foliolosa]|uniref:NAC domain-containing protein n=1 Tax=Castilleja foliolosa TaxID=1961234 RepID=A0ABD3DL40_9LAMI